MCQPSVRMMPFLPITTISITYTHSHQDACWSCFSDKEKEKEKHLSSPSLTQPWTHLQGEVREDVWCWMEDYGGAWWLKDHALETSKAKFQSSSITDIGQVTWPFQTVFFHLKNRENDSTYLLGMLWKLNEMIHVKCLAQHLVGTNGLIIISS